MSLIKASGLAITQGGRAVLHDVDLRLARGEIVTVVGPNGSGKSTLIRALIGAIPPQAGSITRAPGLRIGYVPQKLGVDATMPLTVRRFLDLPCRVGDEQAMSALHMTGAGHTAKQQLADLSGGQFQRVLLARATLAQPDILVLDEPTQGLDQPGTADFYALIGQLRDRLGCAVLLVSHDLHVVMSATDRVICLNGHVCCHGTPQVVSAASEYRALFGLGTHGALALYRHDHDHDHDHDHEGGHDHHHPHEDDPHSHQDQTP